MTEAGVNRLMGAILTQAVKDYKALISNKKNHQQIATLMNLKNSSGQNGSMKWWTTRLMVNM